MRRYVTLRFFKPLLNIISDIFISLGFSFIIYVLSLSRMCALVIIEPVSRLPFKISQSTDFKARRHGIENLLKVAFYLSFWRHFSCYALCNLFLFLPCSNSKMFKSCFRNHKECILNFAERERVKN